jgi:hypothetical protein
MFSWYPVMDLARAQGGAATVQKSIDKIEKTLKEHLEKPFIQYRANFDRT